MDSNKWQQLVLFVVIYFINSSASFDGPGAQCTSQIYCSGSLLKTVQLARVFNDSKTFVDLPLKYDPSDVLLNFYTMMKTHDDNPSRNDVVDFVNANFDQSASEFEPFLPMDFRRNPKFLSRIRDPSLKSWASALHDIWVSLVRKISPEVKKRPQRHSILYVPNPFVVPGGRFKEFYYWDSYWVQEGLLLSEMSDMVKGMIQNFAVMVKQVGYVPNGGRIYYDRSQPPMLIPMVKNYVDATKDYEFLEEMMETLDKEFNFWMKHRTVIVNHLGKEYTMARYSSPAKRPRPESYFEDYWLAQQFKTQKERHELYDNLHSTAESGWDFSTRWFIPAEGGLADVKTRNIIPVDLNSILYYNAKLMTKFYIQLGDPIGAVIYKTYAKSFKAAINEVLWDEASGAWFDYDFTHRKLRKNFFPSNIVPLWAGVQTSDSVTKRVINYLNNSTALSFLSGVPASLDPSGEQWDFPNGWAPLQSFIVHALERCQDEKAKEMAFELASKWLRTNYVAFTETQPNSMFEKYDVTSVGVEGGGGEYVTQVGFGWTNGVALSFLNLYGDKLEAAGW